MKCPHCNTLNKDGAKFCKNCGKPINQGSLAFHDKFDNKNINNTQSDSNSSNSSRNTLIICITTIICVIIILATVIYINSNQGNTVINDNNQATDSVNPEDLNLGNDNKDISHESSDFNNSVKSWQLVDKYYGSGSGIESYNLPEGKVKVEISAFPIKNYATNHLYVSSSSGESLSLDWGSKSKVKAKSDSMIFDASNGDIIDIDYYETTDWEVKIYKYS